MTKKSKPEELPVELQECFIIMPISDPDSHDKGHFKLVYDSIFKVACDKAGFKAHRADDEKSTSMIHANILKKILQAPIAICDLSTLNPNVLFELGIRQAFDMPVVLVQEKGTRHIFDLAPIKTIEYCKEMKYHDVIVFQEQLSIALRATMSESKKSDNSNSIVKFLALQSAAKLPNIEGNESSMNMNLIQSEMREMRKLIESNNNEKNPRYIPHQPNSLRSFRHRLSTLNRDYYNKNISPNDFGQGLQELIVDLEKSRKQYTSLREHEILKDIHVEATSILEAGLG